MDLSQATISISSLHPDEWEQIRAIALRLYDEGKNGKDQFKISVIAFMQWAQKVEQQIEIAMMEDGTLH
jgi:hypothetical protein